MVRLHENAPDCSRTDLLDNVPILSIVLLHKHLLYADFYDIMLKLQHSMLFLGNEISPFLPLYFVSFY